MRGRSLAVGVGAVGAVLLAGQAAGAMPTQDSGRARVDVQTAAPVLPSNCELGSDLLTVTCTYGYTGASQSFTVPDGVQPGLQLTVDGAGAADSFAADGIAAKGGESTGIVTAAAGTVLTLVVGRQGQAGHNGSEESGLASGAAATYGGGGQGGSANSPNGSVGGDSGGGGSFVVAGTTPLLIAGGAGGTGLFGCAGGTGGGAGASGAAGAAAAASAVASDIACTDPGASAAGAAPGTSTAGGSGTASTGGDPGTGGAGQDDTYNSYSRSANCGGAGGGGGYAGGAGGGATQSYTNFFCGGGGGGSGYAASTVQSAGGQAGVRAGDGQIVITYALVPIAPVVTQQPSDQTVNEGGRGTFRATATGLPSPTVQWQESTDSGGTFHNIAGSTTETYQTPDTTPADDGEQFRAVFTNSGGSVTTSAAALTVQTAPAFTTPAGALPSGTVGQPYSTTISDTGKPAPTDTVTSGQLPPGLTLSGDPVLSGTPTTAGTFTFALHASNAAGSADRTFTVTIAPAAAPAPTPPAPTPPSPVPPTPVPPTPGPSPLPFTGLDVTGLLGFGGLLVVGGLLVRLAGRRRAEG